MFKKQPRTRARHRCGTLKNPGAGVQNGCRFNQQETEKKKNDPIHDAITQTWDEFDDICLNHIPKYPQIVD
jgi:hypothetical protein